MLGQSRDELEQIAKIRKIKNYEEMTKEELIISLLKSKQSIAELFNNNNDINNNNIYDKKISEIRRILNRLRDVESKEYRMKIKDKIYKIEHQRNPSEAEKKKMINILEN